MARNRQNLNIIYISDRMRETLRPIASCALTAVVAPMGYGKTTAVRWFLAEQAKAGAVVLQASIYSDNRSIFWKSVQKAFAAAGLTVLEGYDCPADASGAALLLEDLCAALGGKTPYYLFLDDFHLLGDERVAQFLCRLAYRLPENVHLIVASRNRFLPGEQVVRLGRRLHRIEADGLRLNREELLAYTHRCGVEITAAQAESLLRSCEGWFSAVYLNLHALAERGSLLQLGSDIYAMFTAAMLESLPEKTRGFLAVMGLADEFTVEMARAVTALPDAEEVLRALTQQNAFVTRLPDGVSFRFHHMMKESPSGSLPSCPPLGKRRSGSGMAAGMPKKPSTSTLCRPLSTAATATQPLPSSRRTRGICLPPSAPPSCCSGWTAARWKRCSATRWPFWC